jgi:hypothetical protein
VDTQATTGRRWGRPKVAAKKLNVTTGTLAKWRMKGIGPRYSKLSRSLILYDLDHCDELVEAAQRQSTGEKADLDGDGR